MLRVLGVLPVPRGTIAYLALAITCLVLGVMINLIVWATSWSVLLWLSGGLICVAAVAAFFAVRKAWSG